MIASQEPSLVHTDSVVYDGQPGQPLLVHTDCVIVPHPPLDMGYYLVLAILTSSLIENVDHSLLKDKIVTLVLQIGQTVCMYALYN